MNKQYRILNKNTNEDKIYDLDLNYLQEGQTELELLNLYVAGDDSFGVAAYGNYVVIPNDGKDYISAENELGYAEKPADINILKQQKLAENETGYASAFLNGLNTSVGIKFHIKPEDQLNYIGAMIATQSMQDTDSLPFPVIDFSGLTNVITVGASRQAYLEIVNYKAQTEVKRATLLGQINNAQTQEELELIVIDYAQPEA